AGTGRALLAQAARPRLSGTGGAGSELGHRHTADEHQPHLAGAAEVDGGRGPIAHTLTGEHRAEAVFVVVDPIPGDQHQVRVALARRTEALGRPARADRPAPADAPTRGRVAAETAPGTETAAPAGAGPGAAVGLPVVLELRGRAPPIQQIGGDLGDEPRLGVGDRLTPRRAQHRTGDVEAPAGPGDAHIGQAPLLSEFL